MPCEERLRDMGFFSLEIRWSWGGPDSSPPEGHGGDRDRWEQGRRTTRAKYKLNLDKFRVNIRKTKSTVRTVRHWNSAPTEVVKSPSLEIFKI